MKRMAICATAVLALSGSALLAQTGGGTPGQSGGTSGPTGAAQRPPTGGATDQGGSKPGPKLDDGSTSGTQPSLPPLGRPGAPAESQGARSDAADAKLTEDHDFVIKAAAAGMAEVELGKLATEKASNDRVKQFGQHMVTDHGKANDALKALVQNRNIVIPADMDAKHKATRERLARLTGDEFDRAYVQAMAADHEEAAADFRKEVQGGKDPAVKAWAAKTLPVIEAHGKMARDLSQTLGRGVVGTAGSGPTGAKDPR